LSTIIYVDRSYKSGGKSTSASEIVSHVHDIKPHHDKKKIEFELNALAKKGLLQALKAAA
jgi:hypothetical protein